MEELHAVDIAVLSLFGILGLLGIFGNFFIMLSVLINSNLRRVTHMLIANQALSDFSLCALSLPLRMLRICVRKSIFESKILSSTMFCRLSSGLNTALLGAASSGLLLLTLDKFLAVNRPLLYRTRSRKAHMIIPVVVSWLLSFAIGVCGALIPELQANLDDHKHDVACLHSSTFSKDFAISTYIITLVLPLLLIIPMYLYILIKVKKSWRFLVPSVAEGSGLQGLPGLANSRRIADNEAFRKKEMKLTRGIVLVLGVHVFCLLPIVALDFIHIILAYPIPHIADEACLLILYLNAVLDSPIYTRHSRDIKQTMHRLFCSCCSRVKVIRRGNTFRRRVNRLVLKSAIDSQDLGNGGDKGNQGSSNTEQYSKTVKTIFGNENGNNASYAHSSL